MKARLRQSHAPRALKRAVVGGVRGVRDGWQPLSSLVCELRTHGVTHVVDVGANVGQFAVDLRAAGFGGTITSFEPSPGSFVDLDRRAAADHGWVAVNAAVALQAGTAVLGISANDGLSSTLTRPTGAGIRAAPGTRLVGQAVVGTVTWDSVFAETDPARSFVKLDCQGLDVPLVEDLVRRGRRPAGLQFEVGLASMYEEAGSLQDALQAVDRLGLVVRDLRPGIRDRQGRLLEVDVVAFAPQPRHAPPAVGS